jgi:molybdopterin-guanine dinucleotide biosynthesis protein A
MIVAHSALEPVIGLFIGGQGRRMGGAAKGLLATASGQTILECQLAACSAARPNATVVLVGTHAAYSNSALSPLAELLQLTDAPADCGPLGGLRALLLHARDRERPAVALACDMPFVDGALLSRLLTEHPTAAALATRDDKRWQPLFARYDPGRCVPVVDALLEEGQHALREVLVRVGATQLGLTAEERALLKDWDRPEDMLT